jgi:hypothetical protein
MSECECCKGKGWEIFAQYGRTGYPDGHLDIERCHHCDVMTDTEAEQLPEAQAALAKARSKINA